jgi:hypothetical protein
MPVQALFDARQPLVNAVPAAGDEIDEQAEILDASQSLGLDLLLELAEAADELVREPAQLRELAGDRKSLGAKSLAHGQPDLLGQHRLELGAHLG